MFKCFKKRNEEQELKYYEGLENLQRNTPIEIKSEIIDTSPLTREEKYLREAEEFIRQGDILEARRLIRYAKLSAKKSGAKIGDRIRQVEGMVH